jgi:hypothetical protein
MNSIEWLFNELWEVPKDKLTWHSILDKAKQMHKSEIMKSFEYGVNEGALTDINYLKCSEEAEFYYQEAFVSKGSDDHVPDVRKMVEHKCKYCGVMTTQPDEECYKAPIPHDLEKYYKYAWDNYNHDNGKIFYYKFRDAFKPGYNKAKETLYTEEQMIGFAEWISGKYSFGNILGKWYLHENTDKNYTEKELFNLYIQSLKQPKKD